MEDLAAGKGTSGVVKKPVYEERLRIALLDYKQQNCRTRLPFLNVSEDYSFVTYKDVDREAINTIDEAMATKGQWLRVDADFRERGNVYLDLESESAFTDTHGKEALEALGGFGKVYLGKGERKTGAFLTQTDEEGVTTKYSLFYDKSSGTSVFRLHEITLPLSRLE